MAKTVIDTNVFVGALQRRDGVNRKILEMCFLGDLEPVMGDALYFEYESLMGREHLFENSSFSRVERENFLDDFCSICRWVEIHYRWRPNLRDEGDNHVVELAIAAGAESVLTWNKKDFNNGDMVLPNVAIITPVEFLKQQTKKEAASWQL